MFARIIRFRLPVIALVAVATGLFASQLPKLEMEPDTEAYIPKSHPVRQFWFESKERFGTGREIVVAVEATGADGVFTPDILDGIAELTAGIEALDDDNRYVCANALKALDCLGTRAAREALLNSLFTARWCPITTKESMY